MADTGLYKILGLPRNATNSDIKKAYKRLAMEYHPDRNANANADEKFKEIGFAYSILSDPQKRARYDRFGLDAVRESGGGETSSPFGGGSFFNMFGGGGGGLFGMHDMGADRDMFDLHDVLFGGMGGVRRAQRAKDDTVHPLEVTLEDLYNGKHVVLPINREVICSKCGGMGGRVVQKCMPCKGRGTKVTVRPMPGGFVQSHGKCGNCHGQGTVLLDKDKCHRCKGRKTLRASSTLDVNVKRGMQHGQKIVYQRMGDEGVDMQPGDFVVVLQLLPHPLYKLSGVNLKIHLDVSISQALCGYETVIKHLDGRNLIIRTAPGEVLKPDCVKTIGEEGMWGARSPLHGKGDLIVYFKVHFPENHFTDAFALKAMERLLPARPPAHNIPSDQLEEVEMYDYKNNEGDSSRSRSEAYHEDEEDEDMGGGGIRCAHQ